MIAKIFRWNHVPSLLIMLTLFFLSSREGQPQSWLQPPLDKLVHVAAYMVLGLSFCVWIRSERWRRRKWFHAGLVLLAVGLFGITDEYHQSWVPGRVPSAPDWVADMMGGILAVSLYVRSQAYLVLGRIYSRFYP